MLYNKIKYIKHNMQIKLNLNMFNVIRIFDLSLLSRVYTGFFVCCLLFFTLLLVLHFFNF